MQLSSASRGGGGTRAICRGIRDFVGTFQQIRNSVVGEMWGNIKSISYGQCVQFFSCWNRKVCLLIEE